MPPLAAMAELGALGHLSCSCSQRCLRLGPMGRVGRAGWEIHVDPVCHQPCGRPWTRGLGCGPRDGVGLGEDLGPSLRPVQARGGCIHPQGGHIVSCRAGSCSPGFYGQRQTWFGGASRQGWTCGVGLRRKGLAAVALVWPGCLVLFCKSPALEAAGTQVGSPCGSLP